MTLPAAFRNLARHPSESAFVTDFDGTLAPIVLDPAAAVPLSQSIAALHILGTHLRVVAIVSGRPVAFLRAHVPIEGVELVGQYGLERLLDGKVVLDTRAEGYVQSVAEAAAAADRRWPELWIERKGDIAFTIHWRTVPGSAPRAEHLIALADEHGLQMQPGRMACELRPAVPVDKGTVFADLARDSGYRAFAGDDDGDLAAFNVDFGKTDTGETVRIGVRSPEAPPALLELADVIVDGPEGLAVLLGELADAVSPPEQR